MHFNTSGEEEHNCYEDCIKCGHNDKHCKQECMDQNKYIECASNCMMPRNGDQKKYKISKDTFNKCKEKCKEFWTGTSFLK